jgi:hypothetical protein
MLYPLTPAQFTELYHKKTGFKDRAFMYLLSEYVKSNKLIAEARGRAPSSAKVVISSHLFAIQRTDNA